MLNVGTGTGTTIGELAAATAAALHQSLQITAGPRRPGDIVGAAAATLAAEDELIWTCTEHLTDNIRRAAAWDELQRLANTTPTHQRT